MLMHDDVVQDRPWSVIEREHDPVRNLLDRQCGIIARWQALGLMTEKALRHKVASGRWRAVHRGVFVGYGGPLTDAQRSWVAVLTVRPGRSTMDGETAHLAGVTALQTHGLRGVRSDRIHILIAHSRRVTMPAGVSLHRTTALPEEDRHPYVRPPATSPGRSVVDAAAWSRSDDEARLIIAASFQQRLVSGPEIAAVLARRPTLRRRLLIMRTARDCADGSQSVGELDLVGLCRTARLPLPSRQLRHRDRSGRVRYLDACFDEWRVVVEVDGAHHVDVGQMWDDSARQNDLLLAGYVVLQYPVFVLRTQPRQVAAEIRAALIAAGWRP